MNSQIQRVTYYIEGHLNDELDVIKLAKIAGYSHFHFCRVFKIYIGESVMSYTTRLRLERATTEIYLGKKSIINIALDAGYQTPTGFLKAFRKRFGTTPTEYKSSSKRLLHKYKEIKMNVPEIVTRDEINVVFTRELGEYSKSSDVAWRRLSTMMNSLHDKFAKNPPEYTMNLEKGKAEALGICHDDPQVTNEENIRYDAALAWGNKETEVLAKYDFETKTIAGGRYAKVEYLGASNSEDSWYGLYAWVEKNGYTLRDEPSFEKYLNGDIDTDVEKMLIEVYVPIV